MAILMRYEQVEGAAGAGLALVAEEFGVVPERIRFAVMLERRIATAGDGKMIRRSLPADVRGRVYRVR